MAFVGDTGRPGSSGQTVKGRSRSPPPRWGTQRMSGARDAMEDEDELDPDDQEEEEDEEDEGSDAGSSKRPLERHHQGDDRAAKRTRTSGSPEESEGSPTSPTSPRPTSARGSASSASTSWAGTIPERPPASGWVSRMRFHENAQKENDVGEPGEAGQPSPLTQPYTAPFYSTSHAISNQMGIKTQAVFVGKLYAMLEDKEIQKSGLIAWSADGNVFSCLNPTEFSRVVLPQFFKHNNWQSFVRQLNMYGFNKVNDLVHTSTADPQAWEFRHPNFRRGQPALLASIKRKSTKPTVHVPRTPPFSSAPKPNGSPKDHFQQEPHAAPPGASEEQWQSEMPAWVTASSSSVASPIPKVAVEPPLRAAPPPALHRSTSHLSGMRPSPSASNRDHRPRTGQPPSLPLTGTGSASAAAPAAASIPTLTTPRPLNVGDQQYRGTSQSSSSWSGSRTTPVVPPAPLPVVLEAQALQNAILEVQLREQMRKLHRERLDNRASSIGFASMLQRLLDVLHSEIRSPHVQAVCRDIAGVLSKQQIELNENYAHLVETQNQQVSWDATAGQVRAEFHAQQPAPPPPPPPEVYTSVPAQPPSRRLYREDTLPSFAAQGLPPLNLDRSRDRSPPRNTIRRRVLKDYSRTRDDESGDTQSRSDLDGILNR